jgi:hypothetical protein
VPSGSAGAGSARREEAGPAEAGDGAAALDLVAWPEVLPPHPDLVTGDTAADFAADLHGSGDPIESSGAPT